MTCKKCVIVGTRLLARSMVALGFAMQQVLEKVKPAMEAIGYTVRLTWDNSELIAEVIGKADTDLYDGYVLCRSNGK